MILRFSGIEKEIPISPGQPSVLEVENKILFSRYLESLISEEGQDAKEPYGLWGDDGEEIRPKDAFVIVLNPLQLPWDHRMVAGNMLDTVLSTLIEDDADRDLYERIGKNLLDSISSVEHKMSSSYAFGVEWDLKRVLKTFCFAPDRTECESLLDSLILFIDFLTDMRIRKPVLFCCLKNFISAEELDLFYKHVFYQKSSILLLESSMDGYHAQYEKKIRIDQCFLEC